MAEGVKFDWTKEFALNNVEGVTNLGFALSPEPKSGIIRRNPEEGRQISERSGATDKT